MQRDPSHPVCEVVLCEVCLQETLRDQAVTTESASTVHYFCGPVCQARWQAERGPGRNDRPASS
jgi:hypothetical protein